MTVPFIFVSSLLRLVTYGRTVSLFALLTILSSTYELALNGNSMSQDGSESKDQTTNSILFADTVSLWITLLASLFLLILSLIPKALYYSKRMIKSQDYSGRQSATLMSYLTFWWASRLAFRGWKRILTLRDLHHVPDDKKPEKVSIIFQSHLTTGPSQSVSVMRAIIRTFKWDIAWASVVRLIVVLCDLMSPLVLKRLLRDIQNEQESDGSSAYASASLLLVTAIVRTMADNIATNASLMTGNSIKSCLKACVYRKCLTLCNSERKKTKTGSIANLMSHDAEVFQLLFQFIDSYWTGCLYLIGGTCLLFRELGPISLWLLVTYPVIYWINDRASDATYAKRVYAKRDERVQIMGEILKGTKWIRMHAWEEAFVKMVESARSAEVRETGNLIYNLCIAMITRTAAPAFLSLLTILMQVVSSTGRELDTCSVFTIMSLISILNIPLWFYPLVRSLASRATVSMKRFETFLSSPDKTYYVSSFDENHENDIVMEEALLNWDKKQDISDGKHGFQLSGSMNIAKGSIVAVSGIVGSGKSSLLSALLDQMNRVSGRVMISCGVQKIAYVPQHPWILNDTIRSNILFGEEYDKELYDRVLQACALIPDLSTFPNGDETQIGERGMTLSGGQRQRVSLARACYSGADLYLLDDPLSAVDAHVGPHIFRNVLSSRTGLLKNATRILVTTDPAIMSQVDKVILVENGLISERAYPEKITENKGSDSYEHHTSKANNPTRDPSPTTLEAKKAEKTIKSRPLVYFFKKMAVLLPASGFAFILSQACEARANLCLTNLRHSSSNGISAAETIASQSVAHAAWSLMSILLYAVGTFSLAKGCLNAAAAVHGDLLLSVMRSPMSFFETTKFGDILDRFVKDTSNIDFTFSRNIISIIPLSLQIAASLVVAVTPMGLSPFPLILLTAFLCSFLFIQRIFIAAVKQVRGLESKTQSAILSHVSESLSGVSSIHAYRCQDRFDSDFVNKIEWNQCCAISAMHLKRWTCVMVDMMAAFFTYASAVYGISEKEQIGSAAAAIALVYAIRTHAFLKTMIQAAADVETESLALERVMQFMANETEGSQTSTSELIELPAGWPTKGCISFADYSTRYRKGLRLAIHSMTVEITSGEKIGVVGRTGAGKTTIMLSLLRMFEPVNGSICIDSIDISRVTLKELRKRLTVIPQDYFFFSGSLRKNLDPFMTRSDEDIWTSLALVHMDEFVNKLEKKLHHQLTEGASSMSQGQRQLLCLARALLHKNKIIIMDEATAAVDAETDLLVQAMMKQQFADCTVLMIAHRITTVLDCDKAMVIADGKMIEFAGTAELLADHTSAFSSLAKEAGIV